MRFGTWAVMEETGKERCSKRQRKNWQEGNEALLLRHRIRGTLKTQDSREIMFCVIFLEINVKKINVE